jgi:hypothetical protein
MIRTDAWRIPAQNAVLSPTGPAPITVMSRTSSKSARRSVVSGHLDGDAAEGVEARSTEHER